MKVYDAGQPFKKGDPDAKPPILDQPKMDPQVLEMEPIDAREAVAHDPARYSLEPLADDQSTTISLKGGKKGKDEPPAEPPPV